MSNKEAAYWIDICTKNYDDPNVQDEILEAKNIVINALEMAKLKELKDILISQMELCKKLTEVESVRVLGWTIGIIDDYLKEEHADGESI